MNIRNSSKVLCHPSLRSPSLPEPAALDYECDLALVYGGRVHKSKGKYRILQDKGAVGTKPNDVLGIRKFEGASSRVFREFFFYIFQLSFRCAPLANSLEARDVTVVLL